MQYLLATAIVIGWVKSLWPEHLMPSSSEHLQVWEVYKGIIAHPTWVVGIALDNGHTIVNVHSVLTGLRVSYLSLERI